MTCIRISIDKTLDWSCTLKIEWCCIVFLYSWKKIYFLIFMIPSILDAYKFSGSRKGGESWVSPSQVFVMYFFWSICNIPLVSTMMVEKYINIETKCERRVIYILFYINKIPFLLLTHFPTFFTFIIILDSIGIPNEGNGWILTFKDIEEMDMFV